MDFSIDSNILVNSANEASPFHQITRTAISKLISRGDNLYIFPQNLVEFWVAATRPLVANGLGFSILQAESELK